MQYSNDVNLPKDTIAVVAREYEISERTILRVWLRGQNSVEDDVPAAEASSQHKQKLRGKRMDPRYLLSIAKQTPPSKRSTI